MDETPSEHSPSTDLVPSQGPVRPVGSSTAELERPAEVSLLPAVVAATGGFLLGVATFILVRVLRRPKPARLPRAGRRGPNKIEVAASRSFLVDVHLLDRR
ncbi:MAG: hypothetical protein M3375_07540 [Actinomycetota bacterium]|nr:hypothetical protein [Actinomycetota bacterium]